MGKIVINVSEETQKNLDKIRMNLENAFGDPVSYSEIFKSLIKYYNRKK